jgi:hypothetical protein
MDNRESVVLLEVLPLFIHVSRICIRLVVTSRPRSGSFLCASGRGNNATLDIFVIISEKKIQL